MRPVRPGFRISERILQIFQASARQQTIWGLVGRNGKCRRIGRWCRSCSCALGPRSARMRPCQFISIVSLACPFSTIPVTTACPARIILAERLSPCWAWAWHCPTSPLQKAIPKTEPNCLPPQQRQATALQRWRRPRYAIHPPVPLCSFFLSGGRAAWRGDASRSPHAALTPSPTQVVRSELHPESNRGEFSSHASPPARVLFWSMVLGRTQLRAMRMVCAFVVREWFV